MVRHAVHQRVAVKLEREAFVAAGQSGLVARAEVDVARLITRCVHMGQIGCDDLGALPAQLQCLRVAADDLSEVDCHEPSFLFAVVRVAGGLTTNCILRQQ